jgi:lipoprotein-anchoring transpeptidase ErfK/SrfK
MSVIARIFDWPCPLRPVASRLTASNQTASNRVVSSLEHRKIYFVFEKPHGVRFLKNKMLQNLSVATLGSVLKLDFVGASPPQNQAFQRVLKHALGLSLVGLTGWISPAVGQREPALLEPALPEPAPPPPPELVRPATAEPTSPITPARPAPASFPPNSPPNPLLRLLPAPILAPSPVAQANPFVITPELPTLREFGRYAPEDQTVHVLLKLADRKVYVYQGQKLMASYPVAVGRPDFPTPTGEFKVFEMIVNPAWQSPWTGEVETPGIDGSLGLRWIGFVELTGGVVGFHGTPNVASLGQAASHGCVRMRNEDIVKMYELIKIGTLVRVES